MMRQGSNNNGGRRPRGRTNRKPHSGGPSRPNNYDSNGPDGRVRGNARQVYEKYLNLARDAQSAGDRVAAEAYFQYAEHYFRILSDSTDPQRPERRPENRPAEGSGEAAEGEAAVQVNGGGAQSAQQPAPVAEEPAEAVGHGAEPEALLQPAPVAESVDSKPAAPKRRGRPRKPRPVDQEAKGGKGEASTEAAPSESEPDPATP
ncbi:DUF4167 domain-containing protein [Pelagibius litoralis]|uniref:DUF4167 domain-containing protein n=1 Tax=Pelagibius litoralis TaxID=374515 RepID=A0A967F2D3_9PROT|nr:DUF4167 domain-containing protein [Pelagibius litoralis]NIA71874.1 DUF4167 domain-containing protein [Pelagibius litoralis]